MTAFFAANKVRHIEFKNAIYDFTLRSLMRFGGVIEMIDEAWHSIHVRVDPVICPGFELKGTAKDVCL